MKKFDDCDECYFYNREPAICDECENADQFEPEEGDDDAQDVLRRVTFYPTRPTLVYDDQPTEDALDILREAA